MYKWLKHVGRFSVAEEIDSNDSTKVRILAYTDEEEDKTELAIFAKETDNLTLDNLFEKGVSYIDETYENYG